jgi:Flp pilus assembly protein TadG
MFARLRLIPDRRGLTALEFALIAPLFLLLIVGIIESSRIMTVQNLLDYAAREAARAGITGLPPPHGETREQVLLEKINAIAFGFLDPEKLSVTMVSYDGFDDVGSPEPYLDTNGNGQWDTGESYTDVNGNGQWDADQGRNGAGSGGQVVIYRLDYWNTPITSLFAHAVGYDVVNYTARTAVRNEPFRG